MKTTRTQRKAETAAKNATLALIAMSDLDLTVRDTAYLRLAQKLEGAGYLFSGYAIRSLRDQVRGKSPDEQAADVVVSNPKMLADALENTAKLGGR